MTKNFLCTLIVTAIVIISIPTVTATTTTLDEKAQEIIKVSLVERKITNEQLAEMVENGEIPHNVTDLNLGTNRISDISPLSELLNLRNLYLGFNDISDISPLSELVNLKILELCGNKINDIFPLSGMINLSYLDLRGNRATDLSPLINLPNLGTGFGGLSLNNNQITDISPLANMSNLRWLDLTNNPITDLTPLEDLIYLEDHFVGLDTLPVTEEQIEHLHETLRRKRVSMDRAVLTFGHVLGLEPYTMADALQILRYCVNLPNVIDDDEYGYALEAALIVSESEPGMADALQVLRSLVGLSSVLNE